jgi:flagellar biosynthetic protein FliP
MKKLIIAIILLIAMEDIAIATDLTMSLNDNAASLNGGFSSRIIQMIGIMTILSVAPSIVIMFSSFIKISVVLSILRNGLGLQQTPPNSVLSSLALFLTFFVMQNTITEIYDNALEPLIDDRITNEMAWENIQIPVKDFMLQNTADKELSLFRGMGKIDDKISRDDTPIYVLIPAFLISELRKAFEIGFLIFLPFLIIDLVVSSILMAMGMMMLPPVTISLPFKLIFFVLVDGWYMICGSLVKSYGL